MFGLKRRALENRVKSLEISLKQMQNDARTSRERYRKLSHNVYNFERRYMMSAEVVDEKGELTGGKTLVDVRDVVREITVDLNRELTFHKSKNGYIMLRDL